MRAKLLLAFASQGGILIDGPTIDAVLAAEKSLADKYSTRTVEVERAFWIALSKLAVAVRPVTVASLKDTVFVTGSSKIGLFTNKASRAVASVAALTLLTILCVQIQAVQLSSRIQGYDDLVKQMRQSNPPDVGEVTKRSEGSQNALPEISSSTVPSAKKVAELKMNAPEAAGTGHIDSAEIAKERLSAINLLDETRSFWMTPLFFRSLSPKLSVVGDTDEYRIRQQAQNQSDMLYRVLLPALYGLLGSTIYVLRSLGSQLEDFTFTWTRRLLGSARITLGPILGVASVILIDPSNPSAPDAFKHLPQIAIALVAGYSVDVVLSFMDKLTSAFGQPSTSPAQTPSSKP
jgi:hypothetical protein